RKSKRALKEPPTEASPEFTASSITTSTTTQPTATTEAVAVTGESIPEAEEEAVRHTNLAPTKTTTVTTVTMEPSITPPQEPKVTMESMATSTTSDFMIFVRIGPTPGAKITTEGLKPYQPSLLENLADEVRALEKEESEKAQNDAKTIAEMPAA